MGAETRLSEVEGPPLLETDLILHNKFEAAVRKWPQELAVISCHQCPDFSPYDVNHDEDQKECLRWTYTELWQRSENFAKALLVNGMPTDKRFAVFLRNQAEWPLGFWASLKLGPQFVAMHPTITDSPVELKHQLSVVTPGTVFAADAKTAEALETITPDVMKDVKLKIVATGNNIPNGWTPLQQILLADVSSVTLPTVERSPTDVTTFYFTSGTTSLPKPAPVTSGNSVRAVASAYTARWHIGPGRRTVAHSPSFHSYSNNSWHSMWFGGGCVVYPSPTYSPAASLEAIEMERCTDMSGNPSMIDSLTNHPAAHTRDLSSLHHVNLSGSVVHPDAFEKCLGPPLNAKVVTSSFGTTEVSTISTWDLHQTQPASKDAVSVGTIAPGAFARICAPNTRDPVPWGEVGELHMGNRFIYQGWPCRDESDFYREDDIVWMVSGDQARFGEQGELYILGRYKDLIIRGGRNISPAAVEAVINTLSGTSSVVVGLPDEVAGEVPVAVVKFEEGNERTDREVRATVKAALGQYASPQRVVRLSDLGLDQFPLTTARKLNRNRVSELVKEYFTSKQEPSMDKQTSNTHHVSSTHLLLASVWAELSAQSTEEIPFEEPITAFADSLLVLQATRLVQKRLNKSITADEILLHPTINQQATLLSGRSSLIPKAANMSHAEAKATLTASDVPHCRDQPEAFEKTRSVVEQQLAKHGFEWSDVEDIMPCYDNSRFMLDSAQRLQSWNHRQVFTAEGNVQNVKEALIESLRYHPMFRSIAVRYEEGAWLHVVLRTTSKFMEKAISLVDQPESEESLKTYRLYDPKFDHASSGGFLFKATIVPGRDDNRTGLIVEMNHSMYDASSTSLWLEDFRLCLEGKANERSPLVSYKHFADAYYFGRHSSAAQRSMNFFFKKLWGYVAQKRAWWPIQRQPGWFLGQPTGWIDENGSPLEASRRQYVDPPEERYGSTGFIANVKVTKELQDLHSISMVALFKTAVAIFNVRQTGADYAIFSNWEAGRTFPYLEGNPAYASMLPNPMEIAGPTGQRVVNRIAVSPKQTVLSLLMEVQEDMTAISQHAHAPLYEIRDKLAEVSQAEADAFIDTMHRQVFNWVPNVQIDDSASIETPSGEPALKRIQRIARGDCGFVWTGRRLNRDTVSFSAWWDDAQLGWREAKSALAEVVATVKWMMRQENWEKDVSDWWRDDCEKMVKEVEKNEISLSA